MTNPLILDSEALKRLQPPTLQQLPPMQAQAPQPIAMPPGPNPLAMLPTPAMPTVSRIPNEAEQNSGTSLLGHQQELKRLTDTGSGVSQIKNPFLRTLGRIGDVAESAILPGVARITPGTTMNHDRLVGQQQGYVNNDLANQDQAAQVSQRQSLAQQEQAKAINLLHPKTGSLLYDKNGSPIGYQGVDGKYFGADDPELDHGVREVLQAAQRKNPTNAFELWSQQNPKGTAEQYLALSKPEKDANMQQQYLDAVRSGDTDKARGILKVIHDTSTQPKIEIHQANAPAVPSFNAVSGNGVNPTIQAYLDGRIPAPNARTRQGAAIMQAITAADPTYDASRYNTYQAAQKDATSGKTGTAINSLNTIQEHIGRALQNIPHNSDSPFLNSITNTFGDATGGNPTGKFDVDATGIGGEWGKLVAGGVASEGEQKHVQALLNKNGSPKQIRENLEEIRQMTAGKLQGIQKQIDSASHPGSSNNRINSLPSASTDKVDGHWDPVAKKVVYY